MEKVGFSLIDSNFCEIMRWGDEHAKALAPPKSLVLPRGRIVWSPSPGPIDEGCTLVPRMMTYGDVAGVNFDEAQGAIVVTLPLRPHLIACLGRLRWEREQSGIDVAGLAIRTDDRSKILILGARALAQADPSYTTPWLLPDGSMVVLNATQILAISDAVAGFVSDGFARTAALLARINTGELKSEVAVRQAFEN